MAEPGLPDPRDLLSINQAVAYVGVSRRTIYNWLAQGKLETVRTAGGALRIVRASLVRAS